MAKKAKRPAPVVNVAPGPDPNGGSVLLSRRMGTILGCACLLVFILFDELWLGTLAFGVGFSIIFALEIFHEKSRVWYKSFNFYAALISYALAYGEYVYGLLSRLMDIR